MRCYYEVLGVNEDVSVEDLRKSYRRLALQLHPDKNPDNAEEAKTRFQEVQNAYEVLSDPQERAFYDRNKESILHGEEFGSGPKEDNLHLYKYFSASCYSGFNDSEKGFYTVYRRVFESIVATDLRYMEDDSETPPTFGQSDTDLKDVAMFYGYWQSYCTAMTFYWVDKYDIRQAQNRWMEKRIEKENKKIRNKAKKEFNEEVRSLVSFVKKRDKRWAARKKQMEDKVAENARKRAEAQNQLREERQKWAKEMYEEHKESLSQYEKQLKEMESQFAEEWGELEESGSEEDGEESDAEVMPESLYCVACEKLFKSIKAFENHEQSRKHQENKAALATFMQEEEAAFAAQNEPHDTTEDRQDDSGDSGEGQEGITAPTSKKKKKKQRKQNRDVEEVTTAAAETNSRKKLSRKTKQSLEDDLAHLTLIGTKEKSSEGSEEPRLTQEGLANAETTNHIGTETQDHTTTGDSAPSDSAAEAKKPKLKGKKAKDARKAAQQQQEKETKNDTICSVCGNKFDSKNKLFAHLRSTGHAIIKTSSRSKR